MHPAPAFHWTDRPAIRDFVRAHPFGALFAATPNGPRVAHVPVAWEGDDTLASHLGRGNALVRHLAGVTALFTAIGPDAYISPDWYGLGNDQVPTWNYAAVHAYGSLRLVEDRDGLLDILRRSVAAYEGPRPEPWRFDEGAPGVEAMLKAVVGFRIEVTRLEGKWKLSQNQPEARRLKALEDENAKLKRMLADAMLDNVALKDLLGKKW